MRLWIGGAALGLLAACVSAVSAGSLPTVLIDEAHGQKFRIEGNGKLDLSGLAAVLSAAGAHVESSKQALTDARLSRVDAVIVSGPFAPLMAEEIDAVMRFLNRGGRLAVMLHIPFPVKPLLGRLKVDFSNGVIRERQNVIGDDPLNFRVTTLDTHPLFHKVDTVALFGAWALLGENAGVTVIARTSPKAWVDLNNNNALENRDAVQSFGVVVAGQAGQGSFVVFGDDALFQNQFLTGGNAVLARNLGCWLTRAQCE
jgi:hypothetical protein